MSLNFERVGKPIALITSKDDKNPKNKNQIISINENDEEVRTSYKDIKLEKNNQIFQVVGDPNEERYIYYIVGRSGSGKSYFIKQWINLFYHELYKKRPIFYLVI